jgi:hypothetical protein
MTDNNNIIEQWWHEDKDKLDLFKDIIKQLVDCNISFACKCRNSKIDIEKVTISEQAFSFK